MGSQRFLNFSHTFVSPHDTIFHDVKRLQSLDQKFLREGFEARIFVLDFG